MATKNDGSLDWTEPAEENAEPIVEKVEEKVQELVGQADKDTYIAGLEFELLMYGGDKERKAQITAELDRVRGGKAVAAKKETR